MTTTTCCPNRAINTPRFLMSVVAGCAFVIGYNYLVHDRVLMPVYQTTPNVWRPEWEIGATIPFMLLINVLLVSLLAFLFVRNHESGGLSEGLRFGMLMGALLALLSVAPYAWLPIIPELAMAWLSYGLGLGVGLGLLFGAIYRKA